MDYGKAFKESREEMDLTREKAAEMAGCTLSALSKIERGKTRPKHSTIEKFCRSIGIPLARFFYYALEPKDFRL